MSCETARQRLAEAHREEIAKLVAALEPVKDELQALAQSCEAARQRLADTQQAALVQFEAEHPNPTTVMPVKLETDYIQFAGVQELKARGWGFGSEPTNDGRVLAKVPTDVEGLTEPGIGKNLTEKCPPHIWVSTRFGANCSICGMSKDYAGESMETDDSSSAQTSHRTGTANGRNRIKEIVRTAPAGETIKCPICGTEVKASNLLRHYDKVHQGQPVQSSVGDPATRSPSSSDKCPKCGSIMTASGITCRNPNCDYVASDTNGEGTKPRTAVPPPLPADAGQGTCPRGHGTMKLWNGKPRCWHGERI